MLDHRAVILRPWLISSILVVLASVGVACGDSESTTAPTRPVTGLDLPSVVLPQSAIQVEFPGFQLDADGTGPRNNQDAADDTIEPDDTAAELAAQGHLEGYEQAFNEPNVSLGARISTRADLFGTPELALAFLKRSTRDLSSCPSCASSDFCASL